MLDDTAAGFNISQMVGVGGPNFRGDVMLIQAMTNFIAIGHKDLGLVGLKQPFELPDVSGIMDGNTINAIMNYQFRWMHLLYSTKSGLIFTIDYTQYKFTDQDTKRPQMTMLHQHCMDASGRLNQTADYTIDMLKMFPELRPFVSGKP